MQLQNYYNVGLYKLRSSFSGGAISDTYRNSFLKPKSKAEIKILAAKKHSDAEKRRRLRINAQYAELRNILPKLDKVSNT